MRYPRRGMHFANAAFDVVVVGTSAGGIDALLNVLGKLPADFTAPIAVVTHLRRGAISVLPSVLQRCTRLDVRWAEQGARLRSGTVHVAPPDRHLLIGASNRMVLAAGPDVNYTCPAADPLFESAAECFGPRTLGVVLTGCGRDGGAGAAAIRRAGGAVIAQDAATSAHFGMPSSAIQLRAVAFVLPLDVIPAALVSLVMLPGVASHFGLSAVWPHPPPGLRRPLRRRVAARERGAAGTAAPVIASAAS